MALNSSDQPQVNKPPFLPSDLAADPAAKAVRQVNQGNDSTYYEAQVINILNAEQAVEPLALLPKPLSIFAGRVEDLNALKAGVKFGQSFYLWGMPGAGKTALVTRFVEETKSFFAGGVLYLDLQFYETSLDRAISEVALKLHVSFPASADKLSFLIPVLAKFNQCLIILDNAHLNSDKRLELLKWLSPNAAYVVVGQQRFEVQKEYQRELKPARTEDSRQILETYCEYWEVSFPFVNEDLSEEERQEKRELIKYCSGLPLAHKIIANLLREYKGFGRGVLKSLQKELPKIEREIPDEDQKEYNLSAAFNLSYANLKKERLYQC